MNTIIVVEGKSDTNRLKQIDPNIITFETSGLGLDNGHLTNLKKLANNNKIVVFTDPDGPGEIIRSRISEEIPSVFHAYLKNEKAISKNKKKIGIEHGSTEDILHALQNVYQQNNEVMNYEISDLIDMGIYSNRELRMEFCNELNIAYGNNKKVLKQLNGFNIQPEKIREVLIKIHNL